jgi:hypothetical protein
MTVAAYAGTHGYRDETELFQIAFNDGEEFARRHLAALGTADGHRIGVERHYFLPGIHRAVLKTFVEEEHVHQLLDAMFLWWNERPGLAAARPLRPHEDIEVVVDDEVLSSIGCDEAGGKVNPLITKQRVSNRETAAAQRLCALFRKVVLFWEAYGKPGGHFLACRWD